MPRAAAKPRDTRRSQARAARAAAALVVATAPLFASAQGIDWTVIGAAGNRPTKPHEVPFQPDLRIGAVPYEFRISRTEVPVSGYIDFIRAYAPHWGGLPGDTALTGIWIFWSTEQREYYIPSGYENFAADASWAMAARYCNWLHNGQRTDLASFQTGVYDLTSGEAGEAARQRQAGATYWLPTEDEWVKAAYYDPNRYGPGMDGYWRYPDQGDDALARGLPSEGGETNAGLGVPMPVGQYPDSTSAWGVLDLSGGSSEWLEEFVELPRYRRAFRGSSNLGIPGDSLDRLDTFREYDIPSRLRGIRIATVVPTPNMGLAITSFLVGWQALQRRR